MSISQLDNAPRCRHVRLSGRHCKAPARRGTNYCLFHEAEHSDSMKITFPPIEDAASVAVATDQVIQALRDDLIDYRRAALLFAGLRLARVNLKQLGLELGEEEAAQPTSASRKKTREEMQDDKFQDQPSLAEILLQSLNDLEDEAGANEGTRPFPHIDIAGAKARGEDLSQLLLDRLKEMEIEDEAGLPSGDDKGGERLAAVRP